MILKLSYNNKQWKKRNNLIDLYYLFKILFLKGFESFYWIFKSVDVETPLNCFANSKHLLFFMLVEIKFLYFYKEPIASLNRKLPW